jgi:hypothetical protein
MKKLFFVISAMLISTLIFAQRPTTLNVRLGDSEIKGVAGVEFQRSHLSIAAGWRPVQTPIEAKTIHSFSTAVTVYSSNCNNTSFYGSLGYASCGYMWYQDVIYPYLTHSKGFLPEASVAGIIGLRINLRDIFHNASSRLLLDVGAGLHASGHSNMVSIEMLLNYSLFRNYNPSVQKYKKY